MKKTTLLSLLAVCVLAGAAQAAVLVSYTFDSDGSATDASGDVTGGNVTELNLGTYITSVGLGYPTDNVFQVGPPNDTTDTLADAIANNSAFTITLSGNSGAYSLDNLSLDAGRGGSATARGFTVRSNLTGTTDLLRDDTVDTVRTTFTNYGVDLTSNTAFDSISGDVTFTVYVYTPVAGNSLEFDNIEFEGAVVPEPSTLALLGLAVLGLVALRRR